MSWSPAALRSSADDDSHTDDSHTDDSHADDSGATTQALRTRRSPAVTGTSRRFCAGGSGQL